MHAAAAPRLGVQGAFKHRAEDGGAYLRPVKAVACAAEQQLAYIVGEGRYLNILVGEQAAVYIGEGRKLRRVVLKIGVALGNGRVERSEQLDERTAQPPRVKLRKIVAEHAVAAEDLRVLGVKAENKAHAQHVQALHRALARRVCVLRGQRVV